MEALSRSFSMMPLYRVYVARRNRGLDSSSHSASHWPNVILLLST